MRARNSSGSHLCDESSLLGSGTPYVLDKYDGLTRTIRAGICPDEVGNANNAFQDGGSLRIVR
jgi:hypothetical protein